MKAQTGITLLLSAIGGMVVWALSPWLAAVREPWDAAGLYYPVALLVVGVIVGLLTPRPLWAHYLGGLLGQLGYLLLTIGADPLLLMGLIFMLGYTLLLLLGAALAAWVRKRARR
jgi:hypothetical protein